MTRHVEIITTTDDAVLADVEDWGEEWIPRSQIEEGANLEKGDSEEVTITDWFARKVGML